MHQTLLPLNLNRLTPILRSHRRPALVALAARLPIVGGHVPTRSFSGRRPRGVAAVAMSRLTSAAAGAGVAAHLARDGMQRVARERGSLRAALTEPERLVAGLPKAAVERAQSLAATARHASESMPDAAELVSGARDAADSARHTAGTTYHIGGDLVHEGSVRTRGFSGRVRFPVAPLLPVLASFSAGAALMWFADPAQGRRRRALLRDRLVHAQHVISRIPRRMERRGRALQGVTRGITHGVTHFAGTNSRHGGEDAETLVARVRSEILRDGRVKAGEINVDAYAGCVTLRGQLDRPSDIRALVAATKRVDGVTEVRSYLHLPDELPPNKADVYELAAHHLPAM